MSEARLAEFDARGPLAGPDPVRGRVHEASSEPRVVTGGGLVGLVDPRSGLLGVWDHRGIRIVHLEGVTGDGTGGGSELRVEAGAWSRTIRLAGGAVLRERGLLPDVVPAPVIEWTLRSSDEPQTLMVRAGPARLELTLRPGHPAPVVVLLPGMDEARVRTLLAPLPARERQRARHRVPGAGTFRISVDGISLSAVSAALSHLDDAALAVPPGRTTPDAPPGAFVTGVRAGAPVLAAAGQQVELALAALASGRRDLARHLLRSVLAAADPPPVPSLHLAAQYALWTAEPQVLIGCSEQMAALVERVRPRSSPAAFPDPARTLQLLVGALEPFGAPDWIARAEEIASSLSGGRGVSLPVVGGSPSITEPAVDAAASTDSGGDVILPPFDAFAHPDSAGLGARRSIHAARLLRAWVEGTMGARPDAAFGRLRLAPRIEGAWERLGVTGIRMGDTEVEVGYRRRGRVHTFSLRQAAGRVPLNLVFEPRLPLSHIESVRIGGEPAGVEVSGDGRVSSVRCQFPLDPEKELVIVGARTAARGADLPGSR